MSYFTSKQRSRNKKRSLSAKQQASRAAVTAFAILSVTVMTLLNLVNIPTGKASCTPMTDQDGSKTCEPK